MNPQPSGEKRPWAQMTACLDCGTGVMPFEVMQALVDGSVVLPLCLACFEQRGQR